VIVHGNGNQDSQSWYHSQEVNVLVDSSLLAREIRDAIDANQNTRFYGLVRKVDGVWRDKEGRELPGQQKPPKGPLKSLVGVKGAIQRVRGEGGF
jgi:phosphatidylserine/phosphatidylglycerophosphate/cardiolipin synthase-like enzyme